MGSRYDDDDDYDDRPRRRSRRYDDDDDDDRPPPRRRPRRRRSGGGANVGKVIGISVGVLAGIGILIGVVLALRGSGIGGGSINFAQYSEIGEKDTIESLEKKYGRGRKIDPKEWDTTAPGFGSNVPRGGTEGAFGAGTGTTLYGYHFMARSVTAWYVWRRGREEVYVAEGTDKNGRTGLVIKVYMNPKIMEDAIVRHTPAPHSWFAYEGIGGGLKIQFGGEGGTAPFGGVR
jgi:hypothetical protein